MSNMDIRVWGPNAWDFMHTVTFSYPESPTTEEMTNMKHFFYSTSEVLPCTKCRSHFSRLVHTEYPITDHLTSKETLSKWLVEAHNLVNDRLGKPRLSYDFVRQKYEYMADKCEVKILDTCQPATVKRKWIIGVITGIVGVLLIVCICYWMRRRSKPKMLITSSK
jgi:hypothetical protein